MNKKTLIVLMIISFANIFAQYTPPSQITSLLNKYRSYSDLEQAASNLDEFAYNITTWQMDHGGFSKAMIDDYANSYDGYSSKSAWTSNGIDLGTFDNDATIMEIRFLADRYSKTSNSTYKQLFQASIEKAIDFILVSQYPSGAWPQVYPERTGTTYSNMATYNDDAMVRVLVLIKDIIDNRAPFNLGIVASDKVQQLKTAFDKCIDYTLKAQIINNGKRTVWGQQHDPYTYKPVGARSYELPGKSGSESRGVVYLLMNLEDQTSTIKEAVTGAYEWYVKNKTNDLKFSNGELISSPGSSLWYRYYNIEDDTPFFSDRDGVKVFDLMQVSEERRTGYQWAGDYGSQLIDVYHYYQSTVGQLPPSSSSEVPSSSSQEPSSSSEVVSSSSQEPSSSSQETIPQPNLTYTIDDYCGYDGISETKNTGFVSSAYLNLDNKISAAMNFKVNMTANANVDFLIAYANGGTSSRPMDVYVNGEKSTQVDFANHSTWTIWEQTSVNLALNAGTNEIELISQLDDGGPNIDWIGSNNTEVQKQNCDEIVAIDKIKKLTSTTEVNLSSEYLSLNLKEKSTVEIYNILGENLYQASHISGVVDIPISGYSNNLILKINNEVMSIIIK